MTATLDHAISPMLQWYWQLGWTRHLAVLPVAIALMLLLGVGMVLTIVTWGRL